MSISATPGAPTATAAGASGSSPRPGCRDSTAKLRQLCDADQRSTDHELRLLAGAVVAGQPMPDPERTREQFHDVLTATRAYLQTQPSARSVRSAGMRVQKAIAHLIGDEVKARREEC